MVSIKRAIQNETRGKIIVDNIFYIRTKTKVPRITIAEIFRLIYKKNINFFHSVLTVYKGKTEIYNTDMSVWVKWFKQTMNRCLVKKIVLVLS